MLVPEIEQGRRRRTRRRPRRARRWPGSRPAAAASAAIPSRSSAIAPVGSGRPVGLFGLQSQTSPGRRRPLRAWRRGRGDSRRPRPEPRDDHDDRAPLLGHDAVHRVGRGGDDGPAARRQERLRRRGRGSRPPRRRRGARRSRRRRRGRPSRRAGGSPTAGTRRAAPRTCPPARIAPTSSGGAGDVFRSNRRICVDRDAEASGDLLVGRLPAVARGLGRQAGRDRAWGSSRRLRAVGREARLRRRSGGP